MSLVKQLNGKWYKQLTCNKIPVLVEWDPMSETKAYNRAFNQIPSKDPSDHEKHIHAVLWANRSKSSIARAWKHKLWNRA